MPLQSPWPRPESAPMCRSSARAGRKDAQDALLCLGEKRIRQASSTGLTGAGVRTQYGHNHARFGHERQTAVNRDRYNPHRSRRIKPTRVPVLATMYPGLDMTKAFHEDHIFPRSRFTRTKLVKERDV